MGHRPASAKRSAKGRDHFGSSTKKKFEIAFAVLILIFFAVFFVVGLAYPPRPRELPLLVDVIGMALISWHLIGLLRKPAAAYKKPERPLNWRVVNLGFASMLAYLAATYFIGMVLSSFIIVYGCGRAYGAKNKKVLLVVSLSAVVIVYLVFVLALKVNLYRGIFFM